VNAPDRPGRILVTTVALASFSQLAAYICVPAVPAIGAALTGLNGEWVVAVYLGVGALAQLVWGPLSDGLGRRRTVWAGLVVGVVGTLVCASATGAVSLMLGRVLQAAGIASCLVNSRAMLRDRFAGASLAAVLATSTVWIALVPTLTPVLGGVLTNVLGWRGPFGFTVLAALAVLALVACTVAADGPRKPVRFGTYRDSLGDERLVRGAAAGGCHFGALSALTVGVPAIAMQVGGLSAVQVGLLISAMTPMFILGAVAARRFPRLGSTAAVCVGLIVQAGCVAMALVCLWVGGVALIFSVVCIAGYSVVQGTLLPALMTRALSGTGSGSGTAASVFGSLQIFGGGVGSALLPVAGAMFGIFGAGAVTLVLLVTTFAFVAASQSKPVAA
jgi:DHA1 family bicyclomycin/chloramphenicol resistance-like MFS transporter